MRLSTWLSANYCVIDDTLEELKPLIQLLKVS